MTQVKRNEHKLGNMMRSYGYYVHKWGDVRYARCPSCAAIFPLPKAEKKPDFLIAMEYRYVEAKGAGDSWHFDGDFRPNQIEFMDNNPHNSWIFVEMGTGRAPDGKIAFLMPWKTWKEVAENLLEKGYKSIRFESTNKSRVPVVKDVIDEHYLLEWEKGNWKIRNNHMWWKDKI